MSKILVVDDEEKVCWAFEQFLREEGHEPLIASSGQEALDKMASEKPDLVIMDIRMPGKLNGIQALTEMKKLDPDVYVIIMTAYGSMQTTIEAMQAGAYDFIVKPIDLDQVGVVIQKAIKSQEKSRELDLLRSEVMGKYQKDNLIGKTPQMQEIYKTIGNLTTNDVTVLIEGETGVGKELVAKAIHYNSIRKDKPFVPVNCAALTESLLESELFGHEKGSFTGAVTRKPGKFEIVKDGTLFLDEIGDISHNMQMKLLRVLDNRTFERVGSNEHLKMRARIIAATNKNMAKSVNSGQFRKDLYYRLRVVSIQIPPLRKRKEDLPLLVRHFLSNINEELGRNIKGVDPRVMELMMAYDWPGNVRELENLIKSAAVLCRSDIILPEHLPSKIAQSKKESEFNELEEILKSVLKETLDSGSDTPYSDITEYVEKILVEETLNEFDGNQVKAAEKLGISRTTLRKKMKE
ncbi:response regulator [Candidatus Poribacteria bacterium]|nr:response regulator [Candidatus Poribacteria bacterium]